MPTPRNTVQSGPLTQAEIDHLRSMYSGDDGRNIAVDAQSTPMRDESGTWVQAWVWLPAKEAK